MWHVAVQREAFDLNQESQALRAGRRDVGAEVSFVGYVRDFNERPEVQALTLEHYPGMTEQQLQMILQQAAARWPLLGARLIHRVGRLEPGDAIVLVLVSSAHRQAAFSACEFIMDYLKTQAPFWKKEHTATGDYWVSERDTDQQAQARWGSYRESNHE
ncbi:molybdopterin synthase catalytic subunit MoaE [Nitrincola tapanii]|uniref:Molybdopterin synthase catalytic subunit n=1 Tax=Nitrincola tapanii TaxID=1708751 RepID=A0A5A9W3L4_9GAMM|nr:molybdopterin synthase catalytic subunit MoaE [Nitrincola tapanii]KAA0875084.1 molybdopterin synthase catalytic subunit MoaE [Nitrincola tapanii]